MNASAGYSPRVKICGITTKEDAGTAVRFGAHGVGCLVGLLDPSEDEVSAEVAGEILAGLPPFVSGTLVTHRTEPPIVRDLCRRASPQVLQLHGPYPVEAIGELRAVVPAVKIIKAVHVEDERSVEVALQAAEQADAILLDTKTATRIGGTGLVHDWSLSRRIRDAVAGRARDASGMSAQVILAGGLTPDNVGRAIVTVRPFAVDVNSGVSLYRGRKSPVLVERFIAAVRRAAMEVPALP